MIDLNIEYHVDGDITGSSDTNNNSNSDSDSSTQQIEEVDNNVEGNNDATERENDDVQQPMTQPVVSPRMGMTFTSYSEVIDFYHNFGRQSGFQMKIRSRESVDNSATRLRLACTKEGKFVSKGKDPTKSSRSQVTGCKAKVTATLDKKSGEWKLTTVVLEHNHTLDPSSSKLMSNYRFISEHNKELIMNNEKAGIPIGRNFATFAVRYGGYGEVPFSEKDCRNLVTKHRRLCLQEGDFAAMEKHFMEMSIKDPNFIYMYDTSDDGSLKNIFWADGRCREAFRDFGDVISFDTTYLKNRYRMPFCPFIGVNHHGQSILLGCALISGEDTSNYVWLFKTWLACMLGKTPKCILTDQCMAIGKTSSPLYTLYYIPCC